MKNWKTVVFISAFLFSAADFCLAVDKQAGQDEKYPKIAFAKKDGSNVRAGDNVNYESLCMLRPGDPVKITGKRYSWYRIELPSRAHVYISGDYVDYDDRTRMGAVTGENVNLRAGAGTKYTILGQVSAPEKIGIVSEKDGWYEIFPPDNVSGWIHSSQVVFSMEGIERAMPDKKAELPRQKLPAQANTNKSSVTLNIKDNTPKGNLKISTTVK